LAVGEKATSPDAATRRALLDISRASLSISRGLAARVYFNRFM